MTGLMFVRTALEEAPAGDGATSINLLPEVDDAFTEILLKSLLLCQLEPAAGCSVRVDAAICCGWRTGKQRCNLDLKDL